uniref:Cyclic nucleotide-binding domain-containing protein n=1 Tax=Glossina morsitans morsitans TaxID=37546 RepID=A0A1B0FQL9_GLOMM
MATKRTYRKNEDELNRRKAARLRFQNLIRNVAWNRIWLVDAGDQKLSLNVKKNINMLVRTRRKIGLLTIAIVGKWVNKIQMLIGPGECVGDVELIEGCLRTQTLTTTNVVELLVVFEEDFNAILRKEMTKHWNERKAALMCLDSFKSFTREQIIDTCKVSLVRQFEPLETIYYEDKGQASYVHFVISGECMILQCLKMRVTKKDKSKHYELVDIANVPGRSSIFAVSSSREIMRVDSRVDVAVHGNVYDIDELLESDEKGSAVEIHKVDLRTIEAKCQALRFPVKEASSTPSSYISWSIEGELEENYENEEEFEYEEPRRRRTRKSNNLTKKSSRRHRVPSMSDREEREAEEQETVERGEEGADNVSLSIASHSMATSALPPSILTSSAASTLSSSETQQLKETALQRPLHYRRKKQKHEQSELEETDLHSKSFVHIADIDTSQESDESDQYWIPYHKPAPVRENHFIDVGSLTFGGIFGLGEKSEHRVIMARTTVQCLLIPRFWLFEKEQCPGNIWQRRRFYLDSTIPSRDTLFKDFLTTLQWQKFKADVLEEYVGPGSAANATQTQDVPIICRIVEASDE